MPGGRPSDIDKVISVADDGTRITVFERFVQLMRVGSYFEHAAPACGIGVKTAYGWLHRAAKAKLANGGDVDLDALDVHTRRCIEFSDAVDRATGEWLAGELTRLQQIEQGGIQREITVEKYENGELVSRQVRRESTLPDARVTMWRLSRRFQFHYGDKIEVLDPANDPRKLPETDQREVLAQDLESYLRGIEDERARAEAEAAKPKRTRAPRRIAAAPPE